MLKGAILGQFCIKKSDHPEQSTKHRSPRRSWVRLTRAGVRTSPNPIGQRNLEIKFKSCCQCFAVVQFNVHKEFGIDSTKLYWRLSVNIKIVWMVWGTFPSQNLERQLDYSSGEGIGAAGVLANGRLDVHRCQCIKVHLSCTWMDWVLKVNPSHGERGGLTVCVTMHSYGKNRYLNVASWRARVSHSSIHLWIIAVRGFPISSIDKNVPALEQIQTKTIALMWPFVKFY